MIDPTAPQGNETLRRMSREDRKREEQAKADALARRSKVMASVVQYARAQLVGSILLGEPVNVHDDNEVIAVLALFVMTPTFRPPSQKQDAGTPKQAPAQDSEPGAPPSNGPGSPKEPEVKPSEVELDHPTE